MTAKKGSTKSAKAVVKETKKTNKQIIKDTKAINKAMVKGAKAAVKEAKALEKNQRKLSDGTIITVRGTDERRTGYIRGNVGWQDFLRPARQSINLTTALIGIGAPDKLVKVFKGRADSDMAILESNHVKIPSDMVTGHLELDTLNEHTVGTYEFSQAIRKLSALVKFVTDDKDKKAVQAELLSARQAQKQAG